MGIMRQSKSSETNRMEPLLLRATEVARRMSIGRATVYRMIVNKELPSLKLGNIVRVPARALEELIDQQTQSANTR